MVRGEDRKAFEDTLGKLPLRGPVATYTGTARASRTSDVPKAIQTVCKCCPDGDHVFSRGIDPDSTSYYYKGEPQRLTEFVDLWLYRHPEAEGRKVKITIELVGE